MIKGTGTRILTYMMRIKAAKVKRTISCAKKSFYLITIYKSAPMFPQSHQLFGINFFEFFLQS